MLWAAAHPVMTVTQSGLGFLVSGSSAQLPRAPNRLPESLVDLCKGLSSCTSSDAAGTISGNENFQNKSMAALTSDGRCDGDPADSTT